MLGIEFQTWCLNFTTIQQWMVPRLLFFWNRFCGMRESERFLRGGEKKTKLRGRGGAKAIVSLKTDLTCRYLYLGYLQLIIYSIYLFLLFYKKELYFISYQMNKSYIYIYIYIYIYMFKLLFYYNYFSLFI